MPSTLCFTVLGWGLMSSKRPVIGVAGGGLRCSQNFPNKAHVRQETTWCARVGTSNRELNSVLLEKYILSPKYMYWECRWRGYSEMADQPKIPLKVLQSCSNFHRILSLQQWMKLHWSQDLKGDIKDFSSAGGAGLLSLKGGMSNIS